MNTVKLMGPLYTGTLLLALCGSPELLLSLCPSERHSVLVLTQPFRDWWPLGHKCGHAAVSTVGPVLSAGHMSSFLLQVPYHFSDLSQLPCNLLLHLPCFLDDWEGLFCFIKKWGDRVKHGGAHL